MAVAQPSRLNRLLAMVPYFQAHRGISVAQAARDLGVSQSQLTKDLELLFVCGLPGYYPDDLIELEFSEGFVSVGFTAGMDRPLRLTTVEASTLLVALRALVETPGVVDVAAARRAIAKIEEAVGATVPAVSGASDETSTTTGENPTYATIREASKQGRALRLRYYSASRDSVSERVVDPIRLQVMDQHTYLEAWCRMAEGVRLFRFDRVDTATALDEPSRPPADAGASTQSVLVAGNPDLPSVELEIDADHLWILDYYPVEPTSSIEDRTDPELPVRARLVYGSPEWLTRFLLGFGGSVRVVDAPAISAAVAESATAARARYR
ncbi:WYL domain-containing protein [Gordonia jinghuaiqii]|uniref:WYL domain-containing protein n=1 Tax=Gordonia jinghuaiqii TaxID=2758710 RepID=A0A7D7LP54_9ACTN|nr:WYL domain-containing protein [Gordonia jinghuaiqii]MCR5976500.1 WYL domain-containing protein [Gordonia jinghuaiqii]QMS99702.1 WYL domain-containing protein [Gordonia jinghuaiqii]